MRSLPLLIMSSDYKLLITVMVQTVGNLDVSWVGQVCEEGKLRLA
jgi:hypothetical protein